MTNRYTCMESRYYAEKAKDFERLADQSWYRFTRDTINDHVTQLNLELAMDYYDKSCAAYREADRLEARYGLRLAA